ncbi:MAG: zinc-binding alcohol dehydrogenase [Halobacteriales archaeon]|nr:zinc-binding alcohol dehydrogenase [Halobacteriales archaeon]
MIDARRLYFTSPGEVEVRSVTLDPPGEGEVVVETAESGISPGSELLVYRGEFPEETAVDETIEALAGTFEYPLPYGYAAVGTVADCGRGVDESWLGRTVFAFEPHADRFVASTDALVPLREGITPTEATLLPSVETATNLVLDGSPRVGEEVVVFGAGLVGLCTIHILSQFPLSELTVVEPVAIRRQLAAQFGADRTLAPAAVGSDNAPSAVDVVYELSGQPATLDSAIETVGYDGRVVVGSWYGKKRAPIDLGGSFHRDRISLESSQVSTIDPELRGRWDRERRFDVAFDHLRTLDSERLCGETFAFDAAGDAYRTLADGTVEQPHVTFTYR